MVCVIKKHPSLDTWQQAIVSTDDAMSNPDCCCIGRVCAPEIWRTKSKHLTCESCCTQCLIHMAEQDCTVQSCQTSFLQQAQQTPGLDFLVQAIQRGNLVLPAAGSGVTSFAPNNAAFTDMLQTLSAFLPT